MFAVVAIVSLALGIGANAAIFQLIDTVRFRSLPVADPEGLVEIRAEGVSSFGVSTNFNAEVTNPLWEQMRSHQQALASMFAWGDTQFAVGRAEESRQAHGLWVSGDFFQALGVTPERGRLLTADDDRRGCGAGVAVVSHRFWQVHLGGRESAIGSTLTILDHPFIIAGVAAPGFTGLEVGQAFDIALPLCSAALSSNNLDRRELWWLTVMGRLRPGWTVERAHAHVRTLAPELFRATLSSDYPAISVKHYLASKLDAIPASTGRSWPVGTGLGLAIVKELTQAMGGTVEVTSEPARLTVFTVRLAVPTPEPVRV